MGYLTPKEVEKLIETARDGRYWPLLVLANNRCLCRLCPRLWRRSLPIVNDLLIIDHSIEEYSFDAG